VQELYREALRRVYKLYLKTKPNNSKRKKARRYINPSLGIIGFFQSLKSDDINYVVLRWFETLPYIQPGEDIDILVADEDLDDLDKYLDGNKDNGIPCDIYTCSGLPGTDFRNVPYFPVERAKELLKTSVLQEDYIKVPDNRNYFLSMVYHVLYHKGYDSGLSVNNSLGAKNYNPEHDYHTILKNLSEKAGIQSIELNLECLDEYLISCGWRPQKDTLKKLSKKNDWIKDHFFSKKSALETYWKGFGLFVIREAGVSHIKAVHDILWEEGFDILCEAPIEDSKKEKAKREIRGGNWHKGPWPKSGGFPAYVFSVYDYHPITPNEREIESHPGIDNKRILKVKKIIRDFINDKNTRADWCNPVHSADNAEEALDYARVTIPEKIARIEEIIKDRISLFQTPYPVIESLSKYSRRAKVEVIQYNGGRAVCKTFKPGREKFLEREILARKIGEDLKEISEILEQGDNYIVLKLYEDKLKKKGYIRPLFQEEKYFPPTFIKHIRKILKHFRKEGYECVDFSPYNIIYDSEEGLKAIDFEFLQKGNIQTASLKGNYAWYPMPVDFNGDYPKTKYYADPYKRRWFKKMGVPLFFCVHNFPSIILFIVQFFSATTITVVKVPHYSFNRLKMYGYKVKKRISAYLQSL